LKRGIKASKRQGVDACVEEKSQSIERGCRSIEQAGVKVSIKASRC
jgi:hypothetical protein